MKKITNAFVVFGLIISFSSNAQFKSDEEAVRRAVLDYVEALYNVDTTLVYRSIGTGLAKIGVGSKSKETATYLMEDWILMGL